VAFFFEKSVSVFKILEFYEVFKEFYMFSSIRSDASKHSTGESKKLALRNIALNFVNTQPIFKILSLLERVLQLQQRLTKALLWFPPHLKYVAAVPWEVKKVQIC